MPAPTPAATFVQFAEAVSAAYPTLSPQQRVIAQHLLEHPDEFALGTAATVAESAGVQPSALVRFANAMHFSGFSQLQRLFQERLLERAGTYRERISAMPPVRAGRAGAEAGLAQGLAPFVELAVTDLRQLGYAVADATLREAARLLSRASRVHVLAQRRAFPVAAYLAYALAQLELRVQLLDGVGGMLGESLRQIEPGEVLLVTSFKNYSPDVVEAAKAARTRGVQVVAVTDHALSPLKPVASVCLEVGPGAAAAPVRSLVAPMCLAQALVVTTGQCLVAPRARPRGRAAAGGVAAAARKANGRRRPV
ncbi:MAG: MurR/RpiR family transcriptional regulator [Rubrivivax sp.]|nr:MurR/RpiR family transcriptional regulator [Rubrivivax sp.]